MKIVHADQVPLTERKDRQRDGKFIEEAAPASSFYHIMFAFSELIRVADALDDLLPQAG